MVQIKDKKDSVAKMKGLGLNYFNLEVFDCHDLDGIARFMKENPAEEYVIRSTIKAQGKFEYVKSFEEAKTALKKFSGEVTVCVSFMPLKDDMVLVGDIKISKGLYGDTVDLTASTSHEATQRNIYKEPEFNFHASLDDDRVWAVPGFSKVAKMIADYQLYDVIVEFIVFDCPVGVKNEPVVVVELRTAY